MIIITSSLNSTNVPKQNKNSKKQKGRGKKANNNTDNKIKCIKLIMIFCWQVAHHDLLIYVHCICPHRLLKRSLSVSYVLRSENVPNNKKVF